MIQKGQTIQVNGAAFTASPENYDSWIDCEVLEVNGGDHFGHSYYINPLPPHGGSPMWVPEGRTREKK